MGASENGPFVLWAVLLAQDRKKQFLGLSNACGDEETNMTQPFFSILVPVYNAREYLDECL